MRLWHAEKRTAPLRESFMAGKRQAQRQRRQPDELVQEERHHEPLARAAVIFRRDVDGLQQQAAHQRRDRDHLAIPRQLDIAIGIDPDGDGADAAEHAQVVNDAGGKRPCSLPTSITPDTP